MQAAVVWRVVRNPPSNQRVGSSNLSGRATFNSFRYPFVVSNSGPHPSRSRDEHPSNQSCRCSFLFSPASKSRNLLQAERAVVYHPGSGAFCAGAEKHTSSAEKVSTLSRHNWRQNTTATRERLCNSEASGLVVRGKAFCYLVSAHPGKIRDSADTRCSEVAPRCTIKDDWLRRLGEG
jgi:hypothetical protein